MLTFAAGQQVAISSLDGAKSCAVPTPITLDGCTNRADQAACNDLGESFLYVITLIEQVLAPPQTVTSHSG